MPVELEFQREPIRPRCAPGVLRPTHSDRLPQGAAVPRKARVHELAKELGVSSRQILSEAQDLGLYVKSPSSTVEAADARRLRDALTGRGQATPRWPTWPHRPAGNNPYSPPRPTLPDVAPRLRPPSPRPPPQFMPTGPRQDENPFAAALRERRLRASRARRGMRRSRIQLSTSFWRGPRRFNIPASQLRTLCASGRRCGSWNGSTPRTSLRGWRRD